MERDHYDDLGHAFISTFGVLTGSNWNSQAYNSTFNNGKLLYLFYMAWIVLGNWMLLNLFVAILIQGFAEEKKKKSESQRTQFAKKIMEKLGGTSENQLSQQMYQLFQKVDKDGSGLVDIGEMEVLLKECEVVMEAKELIALFAKYDSDGSGEISFNEFFSMIQELIDTAREEMAREAEESGEGGAAPRNMITMTKEDMKKAVEEAEKLAQEAERIKAEAEKRIARQRAQFANRIMDKLGGSTEQVLARSTGSSSDVTL
jgi:ABC-type transport system involved in cytochrome bd biosynthesis fused ATPase/permease subunit